MKTKTEKNLEKFFKSKIIIGYDETKEKYRIINVLYENKENENKEKENKEKENKEMEDIIQDYKDLKEIRFFAVSNSKDGTNNTNDSYENWKKFIEINNEINNYINLLNNRRNIIDVQNKIELKIENNNIIDNNNKKIKDLIKKNEVEYKKEKEILLIGYSKDKYIRFFYGRQFSKLYHLIKNKKTDLIKSFLSSIFNNEKIKYHFNDFNFDNENENCEFNQKKISEIYSQINKNEYLKQNEIEENIFDNIKVFIYKLIFISNYLSKTIKNEYLDEILKLNEIKETKFYNNNTIYLKSFYDEDFEYDCIKIYSNLTDNLPQYQNLLIYNEETIEEEILSFIFRFIKCEYNSLFTIIFQKVTNKNKNNFLFENIKQYINIKDIKSILLILYSEKSQEIIFENIKEYKPFEFPSDSKVNNIEEKYKH